MASYTPYELLKQQENLKKKKVEDFNSWDPMKEDYLDPGFNKYLQGPGRNMPSKDDLAKEGKQNTYELYVTGIPNQVTDDGLRNMFQQYGNVLRAKKMISKQPDRPTTFGFVTYRTVKEATDAITHLNRKKFLNGEVEMRVSFAKTAQQKEEEKKARQFHEELSQGLCDVEDSSSDSDFLSGKSDKENRSIPASRTDTKAQSPASFGYHSTGEGDTSVKTKSTAHPTKAVKSEPVNGARVERKAAESKHSVQATGKSPVTQQQHQSPTPSVAATSAVPTISSSQLAYKCASCGGEATMRCSQCQSAAYCGSGCQARDWPKHRAQCKRSTQQGASNQHSSTNADNVRTTTSSIQSSQSTSQLESKPSGPSRPSPQRPKDETHKAAATVRAVNKTFINSKPDISFEDRFYVDIDEDELFKGMIKEGEGDQSVESLSKQSAITSHSSPKPSSPPKTSQSLKVSAPKVLSAVCRAAKRLKVTGLVVEDLHVGDVVQITEALGANDFYLAKRENLEKVESLVAQITQACSSISAKSASFKPEEKDVVAAKFAGDNLWYRAYIKQVHSSSTYDVHYIDYGNCSASPVGAEDIRSLDAQFQALPVQAVHCQLGLSPLTALGDWSEEAQVAITEYLMPLARTYKLKSIRNVNGVYLVRLVDSETDVTQSLCDQLYTALQYTDPPAPPTAAPRGVTPTQLQGASRASPANVQQSKASARDSPALSGTEETSTRRESPVTLEAPPLMEMPLPTYAKNNLFEGKTVKVKVQSVVSPAQFWVCCMDAEYLTQLMELQQKLQPYYQAKPPKNTFKQNGKHLYVAKSQASSTWQRAVGYGDMTSFKDVAMFFVDTGLRERVPFRNIHNLESDFCSLPFQSVCCAVSGVEPASGTWTPAECKLFEGFILNNMYMARIEEKDNVRIYVDLLTSKNESLRDYMVTHGLGIKAKNGAQQQLRQSPAPAVDIPRSSPAVSLPRNPEQSAFTPPRSTNKAGAAASRSTQPVASSKPLESAPSRPVATGVQSAAIVGRDSAVSLPPEDCPFERLPLGENEVVGVHVAGPHALYVHRFDPEVIAVFGEMSEQVEACYQGSSHPYTAAKQGEMVAACFTYNDQLSWYRCRVLQCMPKAVLVLFCDFGNIEAIPFSDVRKLEPRFTVLPWQAIRCRLFGLRFSEMRWSGQAITWLKVRTENQRLRIHVRSFLSRDDFTKQAYHVARLCDSDTGRDIVDVLIEERYLKAELSGRQEQEARIKAADSEVAPIRASPATIPAGGSPGFTSAPRPPLAVTEGPTPQAGDVVVSVANSPAEFYVQAANKTSEIEELCVNLHRACQDLPPYTPTQTGDLVAAEFEGIYCRGRVTAIVNSQPPQIDVFFIDFGNASSVSRSVVRIIPNEFATVGAYACRCSLHGLEGTEPDGSYSPNAKETFKTMVEMKPGTVVTPVLGHAVELTVEGESVAKQLMDEGVARRVVAKSAPRGIPGSSLPVSGTAVTVSFVTSPHEIYVQDSAQTTEVETLCVDLHQELTDDSTDGPYMPRQVGEMLGAIFEGIYCRARVTAIDTARQECDVFFVDYGNASRVDAPILRPLPERFYAMPAAAARCRLGGVRGSLGGGKWSAEACRTLKELVEMKPDVVLRHSGSEERVQLSVVGQDLAGLLLELGFADKQ